MAADGSGKAMAATGREGTVGQEEEDGLLGGQICRSTRGGAQPAWCSPARTGMGMAVERIRQKKNKAKKSCTNLLSAGHRAQLWTFPGLGTVSPRAHDWRAAGVSGHGMGLAHRHVHVWSTNTYNRK